MRQTGTTTHPFTFDEYGAAGNQWSGAFDLCRESGRPIMAKLPADGDQSAGLWKLFPSGRAELVAEAEATRQRREGGSMRDNRTNADETIGRFTLQDNGERSVSVTYDVRIYEDTATVGERHVATFYGPTAWKRAKVAAHAMELWREDA